LQWAGFGVIQVEDRDLFEAYKRLKKEIKAGSYSGLRRVDASLVSFAWKLNRMLGASLE
jgi:hypothetical protein